jgi:hypothetical protein
MNKKVKKAYKTIHCYSPQNILYLRTTLGVSRISGTEIIPLEPDQVSTCERKK